MGLDIDNTDDGEVVVGDRVRFDPDRSEWIMASTETDSDGFVYGTVTRVEEEGEGILPSKSVAVWIESEYLAHPGGAGVEQDIEPDIVERVGVSE